jgi:outer membrane protein assembly factor BamD
MIIKILLLYITLSSQVMGCKNVFAQEAIENLETIPSPEESYVEGINLFANKSYDRALEKFQFLQKHHPFSFYSKNAMLMEIFLNFILRDYEKVEQVAIAFINLHPLDSSVPYALYIKALSDYVILKDADRMSNIIASAQKQFQYIADRYPNSEYAKDSIEKQKQLQRLIEVNDFKMAEFYFQRKNYIAAIKRYNRILKEYNNLSSDIKEATQGRIKQLYLAFDIS